MASIISADQFLDEVSGIKTCLLLNSRQSRRPCANDKWVQATSRAIQSIVSDDCLFLTSIGQNTWELTVHLISRFGGRQIIVIPRHLQEQGCASAVLMSSFRLDPERTGIFILDSANVADWQFERDEFLAAYAKVLIPVSVRPDGNLAKLIAQRPEIVNGSFRAEYCKPADTVHYDWRSVSLNYHLGEDWDFLTHWTRSTHGPFIGQDRFSFFESVMSSSKFPGSALNCLLRILEEQRIRASDRFIRGAYSVVSFTALRPENALPLMRWRSRYGYYSFEPYGIAIRKTVALRMGWREVQYGSAKEFKELPEEDRPFFQNAGSAVADWRPEAEWRSLGDIDLSKVPVEDVKILVFRPDEASILRRIYPYQIFSVCID